jgi:hypothetical protein
MPRPFLLSPVCRPVLQPARAALPTAPRAPCAQHEFIAAYSKLHPGQTAKESEAVWTSIDRNKNGELSLDELAAHFGYNLTDIAEDEMSDEKILELLEVRAMAARIERADASERRLQPGGALPHKPPWLVPPRPADANAAG